MPSHFRSFLRASVVAVALLGAAACDEDPSGPDPIPPGTGVISGQITGNRTFVPESTYVLSGYVQVASGATLTILPGTKIVGDSTVLGSSLFVMRGGRLIAEGTATSPIVFTSQRSPGNRKPGDWGGIVIIGNARINRNLPTIFTEGPDAARQNYAGGTNDDDNSGSLRYVRIEFAGYDVTQGGQELNSLSMYAVGRGTKIQYVQVHAGLDDGFEWFGGTVDGQYLISSEAGDDHFDWTEGYRGRNQFVVALQSGRLTPQTGSGGLATDPSGFEADGCDSANPGCNSNYRLNEPWSQPVFANFTLIGAKTTGFPTGSNANGMKLRRGTAGHLYNGIVARFNGQALSVRDTTTNNLRAEGQLTVRNVAFIDNASNYEAAGTNFGQSTNFAGAGHIEQAGEAATYFTSISPTSPTFTPSAAAAAFVSGSASVPAALVANFSYGFQAANYLGAFAPGGTNWAAGWTSFPAN